MNVTWVRRALILSLGIIRKEITEKSGGFFNETSVTGEFLSMPKQRKGLTAVTFSFWLSVASDTGAFSFFFLLQEDIFWLYNFQLFRTLFIDTL